MRFVTVIPRIKIPAWYGTDPRPVAWARKPILDALTDVYSGEACILMYASEDGHDVPRLAKSAVGHYELHPEDPVTLGAALVDVDYPNKQVPHDGWTDEILAALDPALKDSCGWYRTPHGMRLVFLPKEPVPIVYAQSYMNALHGLLSDVPCVDTGTQDWTRLFKAPHACRRDLPMDLKGLKPLKWHPELSKISATELGTPIDRAYPGAEPRKLTRAKLVGLPKDLANTLYDGGLMVVEGERHAALLEAAITICTCKNTIDPTLPYHLLLPSALQMKKASKELWEICKWAAALQAGRVVEQAADMKEATETAATDMGTTVEQVRQRLVIDTGTEQFVWDESQGRYSPGHTHAHMLLGALQRYCPTLAGPYAQSKMTTAEILRDISTVAQRLVYTYDHAIAGFDESSDTLYVPVCHQDPRILPVYHDDIDRWLRLVFANELERCFNWLSALPQINRPVCALYLRGPQGIGKGMLNAGITRLWSRECTYTPYGELVQQFNPTLKESPIVWADEHVPQDMFRANDSSVFRQAIGNEVFRLNMKYRAPATLIGYPRILITANNSEALNIREDLDRDDIEAIAVRIGFVETDARAREYLEDLAGGSNIRTITDAWVAGGQIAEHILWLAENRDFVPGTRMLVEGWDSDLTRNLPTTVGATTSVVSAIVLAVITNHESNGVLWYDGYAYVNANELAKEWDKIFEHGHNNPPSAHSLAKTLKALSDNNKVTIDIKNSRRTGARRSQRRFWKIPSHMIENVAEAENICPGEQIRELLSRERPADADPTDEVSTALGNG